MSDVLSGIYARHVLVPVANPATAEALLRLGAVLADPEQGEVLALHIVVAGADSDMVAELPDELATIVEQLADEGFPVRPVSLRAVSAARGILDAAREESADLIVIGYQGHADGEAVLGPVVEAVARTAPSDLMVYRAKTDAEIRRIVIPADGSANSQRAAHLGLLLSRAYNVPITALNVQVGYEEPRWRGLSSIGATLGDLAGADTIKLKVVRARDVASGILEEAGPHDAVLFGFSQRSQFERWLYGSLSQRILRYAPGPVMLIKSSGTSRQSWSLPGRVWAWWDSISPRLTPEERQGVRQQAADFARPSINFFVLTILSSIIASLGLLQGSAAVVIGAMLVAPLMSPLLAFSAALVSGELRLMQRAATNVGKGMLLALAIAIGVGLLAPLDAVTAEMQARTTPSVLDALVALASGAAAAYAVARRDVPAALTGVAIAAALMPPLCTVGLLLAFGRPVIAFGALMLFLLNIVSISLAGAGVFLWLGIRPTVEVTGMRALRQRLVFLLVAFVLLAAPLALALRQVLINEAESRTIQNLLVDDWGEISGWQLTSVEVDRDDVGDLRVRAMVLATETLPLSEIRRAEDLMTARLGQPVTLEVVMLPVLRAPHEE